MSTKSKPVATSIAELKKSIKKLEKEVKAHNDFIKRINRYISFRDPIIARLFRGDKKIKKSKIIRP